jgi:hypothetical protein
MRDRCHATSSLSSHAIARPLSESGTGRGNTPAAIISLIFVRFMPVIASTEARR